MRKFKLKEELKKGYAGIPYDVHLILPGIYISRKLRKYKKGKERAIHGLGVMMANILLGDLRRKYKKQIVNLKSKIDESYKSLPHVHSNKVWVCWMQGMENAPEVVKVCYQSILDNFKDREVVLITAENVSEYAEFPDYVIDKYKRGIITHTHFSDILRLELLNRYGGTWIDATMFCTDSNFPDYMLNDKLFIVQNIEDSAVQIESFFITAESHNKLLELTLGLLYEYWKKHNVLVHYLLMFYFFKIATEEYAEEWADVIPFARTTVKAIDYNLESPFNERVYNEILKLTPIHKLTYKKPIKDGTYFDYIIKNYKAFK
ncbi:MAG: capsular biosynthesis protein [Clostridia bacterium]|jgi:sugar-specific transcriptional regulator TrmB|nr:capsular biosynthesis protein [Clostridia bacterium]